MRLEQKFPRCGLFSFHRPMPTEWGFQHWAYAFCRIALRLWYFGYRALFRLDYCMFQRHKNKGQIRTLAECTHLRLTIVSNSIPLFLVGLILIALGILINKRKVPIV